VHRALLAGMPISPDNTPHGYNLTFAFPMLMFIIIAINALAWGARRAGERWAG